MRDPWFDGYFLISYHFFQHNHVCFWNSVKTVLFLPLCSWPYPRRVYGNKTVSKACPKTASVFGFNAIYETNALPFYDSKIPLTNDIQMSNLLKALIDEKKEGHCTRVLSQGRFKKLLLVFWWQHTKSGYISHVVSYLSLIPNLNFCFTDWPPIKNWWPFCSEQLQRLIIYQNAQIFKRNWLIASHQLILFTI